MAKEGGDLIECPIVKKNYNSIDCNWNETLKNTNILPNNHGYLIDGKKYYGKLPASCAKRLCLVEPNTRHIHIWTCDLYSMFALNDDEYIDDGFQIKNDRRLINSNTSYCYCHLKW
jgi:hypothetical protein